MITYRIMPLGAARPLIEGMMAAQWAETGDPDFPPNPSWGTYQALDQLHALVMVVAFDGERPVGYAGGMIHPNINSTAVMVGTIPTWYIETGPHRAFRVRGILRKVYSALMAKGAAQVTVETTYDAEAQRLLMAMGFSPVRIGYTIKPAAKEEKACA